MAKIVTVSRKSCYPIGTLLQKFLDPSLVQSHFSFQIIMIIPKQVIIHRGPWSLCQPCMGLWGDSVTAFQWFISDGNGASRPSRTWPMTSFLCINSCWKTVNWTPKFSRVQELFVATSKLNSSLMVRSFFPALVWCFWMTSSLRLCVSSTATEGSLRKRKETEIREVQYIQVCPSVMCKNISRMSSR